MTTPTKVALITGVTGQVGAQLLRAGRASAQPDIPVKLGSLMAARFADIGLSGELPQLQGQAAAPVGFGRMIILEPKVLSALTQQQPDAQAIDTPCD